MISSNKTSTASVSNLLSCSSRVLVQEESAPRSDKPSLLGQLNLSASHSSSAVIRHILCNKHSRPNAFGTRFVVPSRLNLPAWQAGLTDYHDPDVALFLAYGWPINYCSSSNPTPSNTNHSSAVNFAETIDSFIETELSHEATAGPFQHDPIPLTLQTSPLQTVDKDQTKRRVVLDLSFPHGHSVNDGIPKDTFLDVPFHLTLPRSADFVNLILSKGTGCFLYKKDLKRAYRQIPVDPKDYRFLGYKWRDNFYFDLVLPFGLRSATMACQRTTTAIAYMFKSEFQFDCINYVDDFGGVEQDYATAATAFLQLGNLFERLGLESSPSKDWPPSTRMPFLGLVYDTVKMSIEVPQDKLDSVTSLVRRWLSTPSATKTELQSLIGKLVFVCACVSPGRIFMQRMLNELRMLTHKQQRFHPSREMLADLEWWSIFLASYNGVSLIRSEPQINDNLRFCTDASPHGIGGFYDGRFFHATYPQFITQQSLHINALEILAVTVSVKLWALILPRQRIVVHTDNKNTELAINSGNSRVPFSQACLRELWLYAARHDFEISACHIPGSRNVIADCLSRWHSGNFYQQQFYDTVLPLYGSVIEDVCSEELFSFQCPW